MNTAIAPMCAALAVMLAACGGPALTTPPTTNVAPLPPAAAATALDPGRFALAIGERGRLTINVHVPYEGELPGTDFLIPFDEVAASPLLPAHRSAPLAVYCKSGRMSAEAARTLTRLGYTDVVELAGGMDAWQADGRPITGA